MRTFLNVVSGATVIPVAFCWYIPTLLPVDLNVWSYLALLMGIVIAGMSISVIAQELRYNLDRKQWNKITAVKLTAFNAEKGDTNE